MKVLLLLKRVLVFLMTLVLAFTVIACDPVDEDYGTSEINVTDDVKEENLNNNNADTAIMSLDRVMSNYFDISLFDEEN